MTTIIHDQQKKLEQVPMTDQEFEKMRQQKEQLEGEVTRLKEKLKSDRENYDKQMEEMDEAREREKREEAERRQAEGEGGEGDGEEEGDDDDGDDDDGDDDDGDDDDDDEGGAVKQLREQMKELRKKLKRVSIMMICVLMITGSFF